MRAWGPIVAFTVGLLISVVAARAQKEGLDAEFAGAGARAMAMGGAFIALADDATAAEFNPAGMRILMWPEVCVQVAYTADRRRELGRSSTWLAGRPVLYDAQDEYFTPSFASVVVPMEHVTLAVSQLTSIHMKRGFEDPRRIPGDEPTWRRTTAENNVLALTAATNIGSALLAGVSMRYGRFAFDLESDSTEGSLEDWAPSANFGLLWRGALLSAGIVYKTPQSVRGRSGGTRVNTHLPYTIGTGIALRPSDRWRFSADVDYIGWSGFDTVASDDWARDDVVRYHLGSEYLVGLFRDTGFFLRAGYMHEESNALRYTGRPSIFHDPFRSAPSLDHGSCGFGIATRRYQLDAAVDVADNDSYDLILSCVLYF